MFEDDRRGVRGFVVAVGLLLVTLGTVDAGRNAHAHGVHASALPSVLGLVIAAAWLLVRWRQLPRSVVWAASPLLALLAAGTVAVLAHPSSHGVENLVVYGEFILLLFACCATRFRHTDLILLLRAGLLAAAMSDVLYAVVVAQHGTNGIGIVSQRGFAAFSIAVVATAVACLRVSPRVAIACGIVQLTMVGLSLSRTAFAVTLLLIPLSLVSRSFRRNALVGVSALAVLAALAVAALRVPRLHARFFGGDQAVAIGGSRFNTAGRTEMWRTAWNYFKTSPVYGHGPGAASNFIQHRFVRLDHPHNDYLRILDDGGVIALVIVVVCGALLARALWRRWRPAAGFSNLRTAIAGAALLSFAGDALLATTDNPIVYGYVMAPLAILAGVALSAAPSPLDDRPGGRHAASAREAPAASVAHHVPRAESDAERGPGGDGVTGDDRVQRAQ
jgi:O-antigen ligase